MGKLYFKYGCLNASKTANLIMSAYQYEQQGKNAIILKPSVDTRSKNGIIESRVGISHSAIEFSKEDNLFEIVYELYKMEDIDVCFIDEANFLTKEQVEQIVKIVDDLDVNVCVYGLKNTYLEGELFEGIKYLLYYADKIEEIKSMCQFCNSKATMNLRVVNGKAVYSGEVEIVGDIVGEEKYISCCRYHYHNNQYV